MIKIERTKKPKELTEEIQYQLTEEFKRDKRKNVWNKKYIRDNLLIECNHKCVYCECYIGKGYKEMHIDHFHYKDKYVDEVVKWDNLNPSCPHCNKNKSTYDTYENPIINPFQQNPQDYFYVKNYRYYSRNDQAEKIARDTIEVLGLNDTEEIVRFRFEQGEALIDKIQDVYGLASKNEERLCSDIRVKNRVIRGVCNILKKGVKEAEYAAFMATIIQEDTYYFKLKMLLKRMNLWDETLQDLDEKVEKLKMQTSPDV